MKNVNPTIRVVTTEFDEDGDEIGGYIFLWVAGARVILVQEWEFKASGEVYGPVNPDPIGEDGVLEYLFGANYLGPNSTMHIKSVDGNYC